MFNFMIEVGVYAVPLTVLILFVVSLIAYIVVKYKNKRAPGTYSPEHIKMWKILLIVSSVIAAMFILMFISIIPLLMMPIALM